MIRPIIGLAITEYQDSYCALVWSASGNSNAIPLYPKEPSLTTSVSQPSKARKSTLAEELEHVCFLFFFFVKQELISYLFFISTF